MHERYSHETYAITHYESRVHTVTRRRRGNHECAFLNAALKFTHIHEPAPLKWE